jgi:hypothetical protein
MMVKIMVMVVVVMVVVVMMMMIMIMMISTGGALHGAAAGEGGGRGVLGRSCAHRHGGKGRHAGYAGCRGESF